MRRLLAIAALWASSAYAQSQSVIYLAPPPTPTQNLATEQVSQGGVTVQQEQQVAYPSSFTGLQTGQVAIQTPQTPQPLRSGTPTPCRFIEVHANAENTGTGANTLVVGSCSVTTTTGRRIYAGEVWTSEAPDGKNCTNNVCINGLVAGDGVTWSAK
jgi:hypothetical protein